MLDNLRDQAGSTPFFQDDSDLLPPEEIIEEKKRGPFSIPTFGLTPQQRFFLSIMVFIEICVLGMFFLLITGKVALPFF